MPLQKLLNYQDPVSDVGITALINFRLGKGNIKSLSGGIWLFCLEQKPVTTTVDGAMSMDAILPGE